MNRKEITEAEVRIKTIIAKMGTSECKEVENLIDIYTGPAVGLTWDEDTEKLELAEGYIFDNDGNIVLLDDVTGPGTGMIYKDGKLVPAE